MSEQTSLDNANAPIRALLLDDDQFMLELTRDILYTAGFTDVLIESDGNKALLITEQQCPDLLICDLSMPGMDGIEFLRLVAEQGFKGGVIVHSSMDAGMLKAAERLGIAHGLIVLGAFEKPIDPINLKTAIARLGKLHLTEHSPNELAILTLEELHEGIATDLVELYYQPKVAVCGKSMLGVECLARWRHPTRGILPPTTFIAQIEQHGLIDQFTMLVLRKGAEQLAKWQRQGHRFKIAVNVSMDNLQRLDVPEIFQKIVLDAGIETKHIVLEITETRLMANLTISLEILTRLRLKGFGLSIDDFGTGFSTMENLKQLPFTELKIDRMFVNGASEDAAARTILESSIHLGKTFHLQLVAEGVETQQDWDLIVASGCDQVQGFFVAKPMSAQELIEWKTHWEETSCVSQGELQDAAAAPEIILPIERI